MEIYLYRASRFYQARTVGRFHGTKHGPRPRTSIKTESRAGAFKAAKEWYNGLLLEQSKGGPTANRSPDFKNVVDELFKTDQGRVERREFSQSTLDNNISIFNTTLSVH
ncbi:MAG: hypothetical protein ABI145_07270, partial [Steroidobacteraceae bacterium]